MNVAAPNVEARILEWKGVGLTSEGDDVVVLVERQPAKEATGWTVRAEYCEPHVISLSMCAPAAVRGGFIGKDAALVGSVTSSAARGRRLS